MGLISGEAYSWAKKTFHDKLHSNANQNVFLNFLAFKFENIVKNRIHFNTSERGLIFVDDDVCCCCCLQVDKPITGDGGWLVSIRAVL